MARASLNKLYRTFVKGLVTEASPLTYPEDTSYDERNTVLSRKGSRTRRRGINYLANTITASLEVTDEDIGQNEFVWRAVAEEADTNFLVVQKGFTVKFFDLSTNVAVDSLKSFDIDLSDFTISGANVVDAERDQVQMAAGKGFLFIVSRHMNPIAVEYVPETDDIIVYELNIRIRDYDGLNDFLANDEEPSTLSKEHHYNLRNQGWLYGSVSAIAQFSPTSFGDYVLNPYYTRRNPYLIAHSELEPPETDIVYGLASPTDGPIFKFYNEIGRYPGNNKQWWVARAEADNPDEGIEAGDFLPEVLNKLYSGNNKAPNGHYILDAFNKDRAAVSGVTNIDTEVSSFRPEGVAFFSGRAWYGAGSFVYFSQILDSGGIYKANLCYQEADPTAEDISDLIASDGGVVPIPEANRIRKLMPLGNGVLVFAQNGVWFVSGGDSAFSATSLSVSKVSSLGTKSPYAAIEVDGTLFWWSEVGINALQQASGQFGPIPGKFGNPSISEQTIQSVFNEIPEENKRYVKAVYDNKNNRILWLFNDAYSGRYQYNKVLLFDLTLQAFFLWEFSDMGENGPTISGIYNNVGESFSTEEVNVIDSVGTLVVSTSLDQVVGSSIQETYVPNDIEFLVNIPSTGMGVASVSDTGYVDWSSFDGIGAVYDSYIETAFDLFADTMRNKQIDYLFCHFNNIDNSDCKLKTKWDWADDASSGRWSPEVEAFRERSRPTSPTLSDTEAFEVITTKNKVRGNGKAIQFRFGTNEAGKTFELLGWSIAVSGNTQP